MTITVSAGVPKIKNRSGGVKDGMKHLKRPVVQRNIETFPMRNKLQIPTTANDASKDFYN